MLMGIAPGATVQAQTNSAPVRLAIVSESADAGSAADVLTAEFSKNEQVQLLERTEIEKVIREQQLSLNNLDCLKLGRLLGADGLLTLQSVAEGTNLFLNLQLVAVKPGVILTSERCGRPAQDASAWSANIAGQLEPLLPKLGVLPQDAIPISVVNFHAGVRTTEAAELERQIFFLTVERLVREKRLFVLERKRMQALSEEKELSSTESEPFWNGKYLLDGAIDRNGFNPDVVTITARLIPPGGNPVLIEASGSRTNCVAVVDQLAEKVLAALKLDANPAAWNTVDEAEKFFKEAQWNLAWKIFPQARQSAEAAWALGKHDADCMKLRVRTYMPPPDPGIIYFPPREKPDPDKIDDAIQAARLYQEFSRNLPPDEPKPDSAWYKLGLDNLAIATRVLQQFNWSPEFYEPVADKLAELRAQSRALAELLSRAPSVHDSYFAGSLKVKSDELYHFQDQPSIYGLEVEGGCLWQEKPEDTLALYRKLMASPDFRNLHEQLWFRENRSSYSFSFLPRLPERLAAWNEADQKRLPGLWQHFVTELKESPDVSLQMEARALRLADTAGLSEVIMMATDKQAAYQTYDKELRSAFTDFFDAFVTNRIYFKTNNVDWDTDLYYLVERMGGDVVTDTKESLKKQYNVEYTAKLAVKDKELAQYAEKLAAKDKELAQTVAASGNLDAFAKQIKFLQDNQPYDPRAFAEMFIFGFKDYSLEQAQTIKPLLAEYKKNLSGAWTQIGKVNVGQVEANVERILNPVGVAPLSPNPVAMTNGNPAWPPGGNYQPGRPPWLGQPGTPPQFASHRFPPDREAEPIAETPAPEPLLSSNIVIVKSFYPLPMDGLPGDKPSQFEFIDHRWIDGKLLLDFRYYGFIYSFDKNGNWQSTATKTFVGMAVFDPDTRRWTVAVLPDSFSEPVNFTSQQGILWRGNLYSSHAGKIQRYDSQKLAWQPAGFAVEGGQFFNLDGRLYRTDYNSIQEITENGHATKLLASIQRQPPVSSLDSQGALINPALFTDAQKNLCAAVHNKIFRWDGNDWHEIGVASTSFMPAVFDDGVIFSTDGFNLRPARISAFNTRSNSVELYLAQPREEAGHGGYAPHVSNADVDPKPLWKLPAELSLPDISACLWQSDLYLMADHSEKKDIVNEQEHVIVGTEYHLKDGYNASLFCFSRDLPAALKVRLKFEASDCCPPTAGIEPRRSFAIPGTVNNQAWMLFTPNLLLCGRYAAPANFMPGIWVASLDSIASEVNTLKQMQSHARQQEKAKAEQNEKEAQAKDQQAREAFLKKYDRNHNGVIDPDEREAAMDDPYYIKYRLAEIHAQKDAKSK